MTTETRNEKYERQTGEQFELLGRFVQAFELAVNAARTGCVQFTAQSSSQQQLLNRVFHHSSLTAGPMFDIYRSLVGAIVTDLSPGLDAKQHEVTLAVSKQIGKDTGDLIKKRNQILHGTWYIGWASQDQEDFSELNAFKMAYNAKGGVSTEVVKDNDELRRLIEACDVVTEMISRLTATLVIPGAPKVAQNFHKKDDRWVSGAAPQIEGA